MKQGLIELPRLASNSGSSVSVSQVARMAGVGHLAQMAGGCFVGSFSGPELWDSLGRLSILPLEDQSVL